MIVHVLAIVAAILSYFLLLIGGLVNPTGSSLACPEALFVCHGQWFPPLVDGVLFEHGHRLAAMTVGVVQIVMTVLLWRTRPALRKLAVLALLMVCAQGMLGALTVSLKLQWLVSTCHLILGIGYFSLLVFIAFETKKRDAKNAVVSAPAMAWIARTGVTKRAGAPVAARAWIKWALAAMLWQILLGGLMRHMGGALASVDWPLHEGSLWPDMAPIPLQLHMAHRIVGVLVALLVCVAGWKVWRAAREVSDRTAMGLALMAPGLVVIQVVFGFAIIASLRHVHIVIAHFSIAILMWTIWLVLWLRSRERDGDDGGDGDANPVAKGGTE